jgi:membrane-bound inhibitor of C-type lysozyme
MKRQSYSIAIKKPKDKKAVNDNLLVASEEKVNSKSGIENVCNDKHIFLKQNNRRNKI